MTVFSRFSSSLVVAALAAGLLFAGGCDSARGQTSDRAAPEMLPDHPMYFTTSMSESIGTFFTFGEVNQAERSLELSERRLAEARALAADGKPEEAEKAVDRYQVQLDRALSKAKEAQANGDDAGEVLNGVSEATPRHQEVLAEVHQKVPEQARPGIERAMEASRRGGVQAGEARSDAPGRRGETGRPESAGPPSNSQGQGPPRSRGQGRPDDLPDNDRPGGEKRPDSLDQDTDRPNRDRPDSPGAEDRPDRGERGPPNSVETGRPEFAGPPSNSQGQGPPGSRGQGRPDDVPETDRPDGDEWPGSTDQGTDRSDRDRPDSPGAKDRPDRGERGPPDSVETARPDTTGGR